MTNALGSTLKRLRKGLRLSQEDLARKVGTTQQYISCIERGVDTPSWKYLVYLAKAADLDVITLLRSAGLLDSSKDVLVDQMAVLIHENSHVASLFETITMLAQKHPEQLAHLSAYARFLQETLP